MKRVALLLLAGLVGLVGAAGAQDAHIERARRVLATTPLVDGHNDLPWAIRGSELAPHDVEADGHDLRRTTPFHTDIDRMRNGVVGGQFWSVYIPHAALEEGATKVQLEQIDIALQIIDKYPDVFELALDASDVERVFGSGEDRFDDGHRGWPRDRELARRAGRTRPTTRTATAA